MLALITVGGKEMCLPYCPAVTPTLFCDLLPGKEGGGGFREGHSEAMHVCTQTTEGMKLVAKTPGGLL